MPDQELSPTKIITAEQQDAARADFANLRRKGADFVAAVQRVVEHRSWEPLGYDCLEAAWQAEWLDHGFKMTTAQVRKIAPALEDAGLSQRAIAKSTGASRATVQRALGRLPSKPRGGSNEPVPTNPVDNSADSKIKSAVTPEPVQETVKKTPPGTMQDQLLAEQLDDLRAQVRRLTAELQQARTEPARLRRELEAERAKPSGCMWRDEPWHKEGEERELGKISAQSRPAYPGAPPMVGSMRNGFDSRTGFEADPVYND